MAKLNECWKHDPLTRPSFHCLVTDLLETRIELENLYPDIYQTEAYQKANEDEIEMVCDSDSDQESNEQTKIGNLMSTHVDWEKFKKHKICFIFSLIFIILIIVGAIFAFSYFIWSPTGEHTYTITKIINKILLNISKLSKGL